MSKSEWDRQRWEADQPELGPRWIRVPVTEGNPFAALPDEVEEEADVTVLVEYRPSVIMGWGMAALWYSSEPDPAIAADRPPQ